MSAHIMQRPGQTNHLPPMARSLGPLQLTGDPLFLDGAPAAKASVCVACHSQATDEKKDSFHLTPRGWIEISERDSYSVVG